MCTVTINTSSYSTHMSYINENNEYVTLQCPEYIATTVEIPNQSIIVIYKKPSSTTGDIAWVAGDNAGGYTAYRIYGDCTLRYVGAPEPE